jgi:multidrug efflux pump subunit AcrA (membrane-fusion protein)
LLALVAVVLGATVYGFVGTVPTTVSGQGLFLPPGGLVRVDATAAGTVSRVQGRVGETVSKGAPIVTISSVRGNEVAIRAALAGTITEVLVDEGNFVTAGTELVVVEPTSDQITAVVYVPAGQGKAVATGMSARLSPSTAPSEQYGQILGTVSSVSSFPVSSQRLQFILQDDILASEIASLGSVLEVTIAVEQNPTTTSGLEWTSGDGPAFVVHNGTLATASVILGNESPAQKLFGSDD